MKADVDAPDGTLNPARRITVWRMLRVGISVCVTGLLLYIVFSDLGIDEFIELAKGVSIPGVLTFTCISIIGLVVRAFRYRLVLQYAAPSTDVLPTQSAKVPTLSTMLIVTAIRNALVDLLPARVGELGFIYVLNRYGIALSLATTAFGLCFIVDIAVLLVLCLGLGGIAGLLPGSLAGAEIPPLGYLVLLVLTVVLTYILLELVRFASFARRVLTYLPLPKALHQKIDRLLGDVVEELGRLRRPRFYLQLIITTLALRLLKYGSLYVLLMAVLKGWGVESLNPLVTTVAFIGAEASTSLPVSGIMGFGAYEGAWTLILSLAGVAISNAPGVILLVHIISQVVSYSLGATALAIFTRREVIN